MKTIFHCSAILALLAAGVTGAQGSSVSMQIIADNDFALFAGTNSSVTRLLYQNDVGWPSQLDNLSTFTFELQGGETTFYLLGMGGGGDENISGTVNGVDLTTINVTMSSDLSAYLTDFVAQSSGGTVAEGTYNASLADVQTALPNLTFGSPTLAEGDYVVSQSPTGKGFHFDPSTAHLFAFAAGDVNVESTPEPSTFLMLTGALVTIVSLRRRSGKSK